MLRCNDCVYYSEDEGLRCGKGDFRTDPFGFDAPDDMVCDFFRRYQDDDELMLGIERYDEIELFIHEL